MSFIVFGEEYNAKFSFPIKGKFKKGDWQQIDLSKSNKQLTKDIFLSTESFDEFIEGEKQKKQSIGLYGGYLEKRALYQKSKVFIKNKEHRSIHIGMDFWIEKGTPIQAPLPGIVHSFKNNDQKGDYGPTIILKHFYGNEIFHTLYGHLSTDSLKKIKLGQLIDRKEVFAHLGDTDENVDWPPHLHFQVIKHTGEYFGDFPGVCSKSEVKEMSLNCPDPLSIFGNSWNKILS